MTEVDVRVKAEFFFFFFNLIIQMCECDLRDSLWEISIWAGEFETLHHWPILFPFISNTSSFQVIGWMCGVAPLAATKP